MSTPKPNTMGITQLQALAQAKANRAESYAHKDKRIRAMVGDGVPKSEIAKALHCSHGYINKVLARAEVKP